MNMKRIIAFALMALLLCLPVWAMADEQEQKILRVNKETVFDTSTLEAARNDNGNIYIVVNSSVSTITLNGVVLSDTTLNIVCVDNDAYDTSSVRIELIGKNSISSNNDADFALFSNIPLTIAGEGSLTCTSGDGAILCHNSLTMQSGKLTAEGGLVGIMMIAGEFSFLGDELTVEGGDDYGGIAFAAPDGSNITNSFTLPEYSSAPAGYTFKAWSVNGVEMQPGDPVNTAGGARVSVKPVFEKIPAAVLPQTGDNSNVILWSALACISVIGMTMLVCKRKEA